MDLKKVYQIYKEDPNKYGLYDLLICFYNDCEDGISADIFVCVKLKHNYECEPDGVCHRDFMELLTTLQDCVGFNYISGHSSVDGIYMKGWL